MKRGNAVDEVTVDATPNGEVVGSNVPGTGPPVSGAPDHGSVFGAIGAVSLDPGTFP